MRLSDYDWRSDAARRTFEQLKDLLRREVLDAQFQGMKQALENQDPAAMERVKDMMAALNEMLEQDARGEHTQDDFDQFMEQYGDMFPTIRRTWRNWSTRSPAAPPRWTGCSPRSAPSSAPSWPG